MVARACPNCGRAAGLDDRFCGRCGAGLTATCGRCGRAQSPDLAYCTACGNPLRDPGVRLAREERRRVSVLFIDGVGSTSYGERSDPEHVRNVQNHFFATVRRIIGQYGGVVEKYIGDAAMALFGAPVATETDAVRCVRAALDIQRALAQTGDPAAGWTYRAAIATGEALVDVSAAHDGGQAIVAGDVVNTGARLQAEAPPGGVVVCGNTYAATRTEIRYTAQPSTTLRGRSTPTERWLALAPVEHSMAQRPDATSMVGRDHELGLLTNALRHVLRERVPRLVTVLGPAGIGKSRLVRELYREVHRLVEVPVCWRSGRCPPFGENIAYAALADIVKAQTGVRDSDDPATARERLDAALRDLVPPVEGARLSDALRPLLGLPGSPLSTEDAESAWRRFLVAVAGRGPTVLVFEDLHWADERMLRFIELLSATVRDLPLLIVGTARPELLDRAQGWGVATPGMLGITLSPLRDESIADLYGQIFGAAAFPPELLRPLVELADGMPMYAHEYVRMLIERGTLYRDGDSWILEAERTLPTPESVHAVIANRIDLLDPADRAVLQAAAVVGPRFWPGSVAAALGSGVDVVERALRHLAQRELVREMPDSAMSGEPEYRFRHILVADVCYDRLPRAEQGARHVRTADWLESHVDSRSTELAEVIAHHRYRAFKLAMELEHDFRPYARPALIALRRAARRAVLLNALDAATTQVARANEVVGAYGLDAATGGPDVVARLGVELLIIELSFHRDGPSFLTGRGPQRLEKLAEALFRAGDSESSARAWTLLGQVAWLRADRTAALTALDRAVELFDSNPDTPEKAQAYGELGRLHTLNYEHAPALAATQVAVEIAERLGLVELRANALITTGLCRYQSGEPDGLVDLQEALEFCRAYQLPSLRRAEENVAYALREEGDAAPAALSTYAVETVPPDAMQALLAGDWDRFLAAADAFLDGSAGEWGLQIRAVRGWLRALRGEPAGAVEDADEALMIARRSGFRRLLWSALAHGALVHGVVGKESEGTALIGELVDGWRKVRTIASGEWIPAAAHAAVRLGPDAAKLVREMLDEVPHHTPWSRAARAITEGAYLDAADRYAALGSLTDRALSLAAARSELGRDLGQELADFAARNRAALLSAPVSRR